MNPYGYEWGITEADGSCHACKAAPAALPACGARLSASDVTAKTLKANLGRTLRLEGVVDYRGVTCTLRGGACACNNVCSAALRLLPRGTPRPKLSSKEQRRRERDEILQQPYREPAAETAEPSFVFLTVAAAGTKGANSPFLEYAMPNGVLGCHGDENSICCPFELDRDSLKVRVIVSGFLSIPSREEDLQESQREYHLRVADICRVRD